MDGRPAALRHAQNDLYGLWKRLAPRADLDERELVERDACEAWDLRNEGLADELDQWVGKTVALKEGRRSVLDDPYPAGMRLKIVARVTDVLMGEVTVDGDDGEEVAVLLLKPLWIEVVSE